MKTKLISVKDFCIHYKIENSFINSLKQSGLIEIITIEEFDFLEESQLLQLEKIIFFYYELDINLEGIETINHLLNCVNSLQNEIISLKNSLMIYDL
jgi:chaperone modulatory protein CbpM